MQTYMKSKIKFGVIVLALFSLLVNVDVPRASAETIITTCGSTTTTRINGYLNVAGNTSATVWFDLGSSTALGNSTDQQTFTSNSNFSQPIFNLVRGNTYYYRAMGYNDNNPSTIEAGDIKTFNVVCENDDDGDNNDGDRPTVDL